MNIELYCVRIPLSREIELSVITKECYVTTSPKIFHPLGRGSSILLQCQCTLPWCPSMTSPTTKMELLWQLSMCLCIHSWFCPLLMGVWSCHEAVIHCATWRLVGKCTRWRHTWQLHLQYYYPMEWITQCYVPMHSTLTLANDLPKQLQNICFGHIFTCWLILPMLVWCNGEIMALINNINNGTKEPTMGINIAIPIAYWYLVGMSRWEHLCILEVLCRSIPLWRNVSTTNVNRTSSNHWHHSMRNHCCVLHLES